MGRYGAAFEHAAASAGLSMSCICAMCTWCNAYNQQLQLQHSGFGPQPQPEHPAAVFAIAACTVLAVAASYVGELDMRGSLIPSPAYPSSPHLKPTMPHINISIQVTASVRHLPPQNSTSLDPTCATASHQHISFIILCARPHTVGCSCQYRYCRLPS